MERMFKGGCIVCLFISLCLSVRAQVGTYFKTKSIEGISMYFEITSETEKTCSVFFIESTAISKLTIPSVASGYTVTGIGGSAFSNCRELNWVLIPATVRSIEGGGAAFAGCNITYIVVEEDNTKYDSRNNCNAVIDSETNVLIIGANNSVIPNTVTGIAGSAFNGCTGLTSIIIPNSVTNIGRYAFSGCTSLKRIYLNSMLDDVEYSDSDNSDFFLWRPDNVMEIVVGDCVTKIRNHFFDGWKTLTSVELPSTITEIGDFAFQGCSGLSQITLPENMTSIGRFSFNSCTGFTEMIFPDKLTKIGQNAFEYCRNLESISISQSVKEIGSSAFSGCKLDYIVIPHNVTYIGENALACSAKTIEFHCDINSTLKNYGASQVTKVIICDGVNSIAGGAFVNNMNGKIYGSLNTIEFQCQEVKWYRVSGGFDVVPNIVIGKEVKNIEMTANYTYFDNKIASIQVNPQNTVYDSRNGCNAIIKTANDSLILGCQNTVIPGSVTSIGYKAFANCEMTSIVIPNSVTSIGACAFSACANLRSATILGEIQTIEKGTFALCSTLEKVVAPKTVTFIGDNAFSDCSSLSFLRIPKAVSSYGSSPFWNCRKLVDVKVDNTNPVSISEDVFENRANATLYVPYGCKATYAIANHWKDFKRIVEVGDGDGDGEITTQDASLMLQLVAGKITADTEGVVYGAADVDGDDEVTAQDASLILQHVAGKITIGN